MNDACAYRTDGEGSRSGHDTKRTSERDTRDIVWCATIYFAFDRVDEERV